MEMIVLIPAVLCVIAFSREGTAAAFRQVVVPTLLLLPTYFYWVARPLPSINFPNAALLALGAGMVIYDLPRWKFSFTDIFMGIFVFSTCYADRLFDRTTDSTFSLFEALVTGLVPYMAGKLLVEQNGEREKTVKSIIWCMTVSSIFSASEYFVHSNPYTYIWSHFFPGQWPMWHTQIRWGGGRVAGPFAQSELAGIIVGTAWILSLWLGRRNWQEKAMGIPAPLMFGKRHIWILFVALVMTQARGPWIGAVLALLVASIGMAKKPVLRALVVVFLIVGVGAPVYVLSKDYLAGPRKNYGSEKETAQYRQELIANYIPIAEKGGDWGWGKIFPVKDGQRSVDNAYLYVWITQGQIGLDMLLLLIASTLVKLVLRAVRAQTVRERHFALTLLGIFVGMSFTISTVFLGGQPYELFFLLVGWAQGLRPQEKGLEVLTGIKRLTENADTRVYT